jgi:hypothetical protein
MAVVLQFGGKPLVLATLSASAFAETALAGITRAGT